MEYEYLIYYIRANAAGRTVGHGNRYIVLDHKISKTDIEELYRVLDEEVKDFWNYDMSNSKTIIVNIMELGDAPGSKK